MNIFRVIYFFVIFFISVPVLATRNYTVYPMTDLELSQLPPFCQVWGKRDFVATDMWVDKLHIPNIHHLCKGLNHANRVMSHSVSGQVYIDNINHGIGEFSYVLKHSTDYNKPLMPFILVRRAKLYISRVNLGRKGEVNKSRDAAINDYKEAIKLNPKFERAYIDLIEVYARMKDRVNMRTQLKQGLKNIPESKILLKKQKKYNISIK